MLKREHPIAQIAEGSAGDSSQFVAFVFSGGRTVKDVSATTTRSPMCNRVAARFGLGASGDDRFGRLSVGCFSRQVVRRFVSFTFFRARAFKM